MCVCVCVVGGRAGGDEAEGRQVKRKDEREVGAEAGGDGTAGLRALYPAALV